MKQPFTALMEFRADKPISSHSADKIFIELNLFHVKILIFMGNNIRKLECAASNGNRYPPYPQVMATAISQ